MKRKFLLALVIASFSVSGFAQTTQGSFDSKGVKISYASAGEGEAVVLLHGWMGDSTMWGRDAAGNAKLSTEGMEGFRIIAMDCRGHGKSGKPYDPSQYGAEMANDVIRLLDHLKIKKAHLVGYSMGSFLIGKVVSQHPDRVLSVIYGGQAPILNSRKVKGFSEAEAFAKAVETGKLGQYVIDISPADRPKPTLSQAEAYAKYVYGGKDLKALAASGLNFGKLEVSAKDLKRCKAPTLFIYGGNESLYTKNCIAAAREVLPDSEVKIVEGADHITTLINPAFGTSLVAFIKAHKSRS